MVSAEMLNRAARLLLDNSPAGSNVILFGSQARQTATNESDADFLVIEPEVYNRHAEMVRLRQILRPLRFPVDVVVVSRSVFDNWKEIPNTIIYDAYKEGKDYGVAA
jgi:predicted nucleotidyltransferase